MLKGKLHRVTATHSELGYEGSCAVDEDLLDAANLHGYEPVQIYNANAGERFATYAIRAERGAGVISVKDAAARKACPGDLLIVAGYALYPEGELAGFAPSRVYADARNAIQAARGAIPPRRAE